MKYLGFTIYLIFMVSWFVHLPARFLILGYIRFDLLLLAISAVLVILRAKESDTPSNYSDTASLFNILVIYIIITIPFVQWPGSVISFGLPNFLKAIAFYYLTVYFITTETKLKIFIGVFLACQTFRIIEPVYLHITQGYWGSAASMANWESMERLSGAPLDVVNPNGLAYLVDTVIPFYYFLSQLSKKNRLLLLVIPVFLYALILTGSRSGLLGLMAIALGIIVKSNKKVMLTIFIGITAGIVFLNLTFDQKDRYLSIVQTDTKHTATAQGRLDGIKNDFVVALHKPFFGHGLGTSLEANANFGDKAQISHTLYAEVAQELGFVGLVIFLLFIKSIITDFILSNRTLKTNFGGSVFLIKIVDAMQVWLGMNILFSLFSYGLSRYAWYLFAGLSVVLVRLSCQINSVQQTSSDISSE